MTEQKAGVMFDFYVQAYARGEAVLEINRAHEARQGGTISGLSQSAVSSQIKNPERRLKQRQVSRKNWRKEVVWFQSPDLAIQM